VPDDPCALYESRRVQADLVLLDVLLPNMRGLEVSERIKANPETYLIPVILVMSLFDGKDRINGIKVAADDFLTQPVDRAELVARRARC
jgi:putative two-component system response regulator